jgi:hypothetical protein
LEDNARLLDCLVLAIMESAKVWIRDNCRMERFQQFASTAVETRADVLTVKAVPYVLLALAAVLLLAKFVQDRRQKRPKTWLKSRSPDPEKSTTSSSSTDLNGFTEKRMKPTERPFGSK